MSPVRLALDQLLLEQKRFWRNPANAIFTVVFPIFFLVIFGSLNANDRLKQLGNINFNQFFTPNIVAFGLMSACLVNLGINLPFRRDTGLLKRMRGTPLPIPSFVFGLLAERVPGQRHPDRRRHDVRCRGLQRRVPAVAPSRPRAGAGRRGGVVQCARHRRSHRSSRTRTPGPRSSTRSSSPLVFLSGTFFPVGPDSVLAKIGSFFPVRPFLQAIFATFDPLEVGSRLHGGDLAVVAAWGAVASVVAVRRFRWEPRVT